MRSLGRDPHEATPSARGSSTAGCAVSRAKPIRVGVTSPAQISGGPERIRKGHTSTLLNNIINPAGSAKAVVFIDASVGTQLELVELHHCIYSRCIRSRSGTSEPSHGAPAAPGQVQASARRTHRAASLSVRRTSWSPTSRLPASWPAGAGPWPSWTADRGLEPEGWSGHAVTRNMPEPITGPFLLGPWSASAPWCQRRSCSLGCACSMLTPATHW